MGVALALCATLALSAATGWGQTTLFSDNFGTSTGSTYDTTGAIGTSATWSLTRSGNDWGARIDGGILDLSNDAGTTANANGWIFGYRDINALSGWNTTLSSNTGTITWEFNMRQSRSDPAGFGLTSSYGVAFVLAGTSTTPNTGGSGYAVVLGQSGSDDRVRLVQFNNGLQGTLTDVIAGANDFGSNYLSIRVTYIPSSNTWELFVRNDGTTAFTDPTGGTALTSQGTAVNSTYTSTSGMRYIGGYWQGATGADEKAFFDNLYLKKTEAATVPAAPTITSITPGNGQLSVAFTAAADGGSAITNYQYSTDGGTSWRNRASGTTDSPLVITTLSTDGSTALANGTSYNVQIRAVNTVGNGTASSTTAATPRTTPGAPTITSITPGNGTLSVAFTAPSNNGGSTITNYKFSTDGGSNFTAVSPAATTSPISITGLNNGTSYNVQIRAVNAAGDGTATASTAATPRTTPTLTSPTFTDISTNSAVLGANVTTNGGNALTSRGTVWGTAASPIENALAEGGTGIGVYSHSRTGLTANTTYTYRGYAVNDAGTAYSADGSFTTLPLPPTVGTGSSVTTSGFTANWTHPTMGNASYTYTVEVDDDSNFGTINVTQSNISSSNTSQSITSLTPSTTYYYRVRAVNSQGSSVNSSTSAGITTDAAAGPVLTGGSLGSALSATYPSASSGVSFTPTGTNLSNNVTVTAQSGYEVSTLLGSGYGPSVEVASGTTVYVRFAANRAAGDYNNATAAVLSSTGATPVNVITSGSGNTISKGSQAAVIGSLGSSTITFGGTTTVTVSGGSGTGAYEFQQNGGTGTVSFSGSGDSRTISVTTAGTAAIEVRRLGDANYDNSAWVAAGTLTINKADQTITFGSLSPVTFGAGSFNLSATASSGLTVSYTSSNTNVATVVGSAVTIVGVGTTTITASQIGNANYNAAPSVNQSQTVNQGTQTITFNLATNTVTAGTTNGLSATASSGLAVTYTSSNTNVASISGTNVIAIAAGVTTITASQAGNANVAAATPVSRTLNVAGASGGLITNTLAIQDFEDAPATPTWSYSYTTNGANADAGVFYGGADFPVGTTNLSSTAGGLTNAFGLSSTNTSTASAVVTFTNRSTIGYSNISVSLRLAAFAYGTGSVGLDGTTDSVIVAVSTNGTSWLNQITVVGNANANWGYAATGLAATNFSTVGSTTFQPSGGATRTTDGYSTIVVSNLPAVANLQLRVTLQNNSPSEFWVIDDVKLTGTTVDGNPTPGITPLGAFPALSTTYGTASSSNSVLVSGGSLTTNITATAPSNFQVSSDGTSWSTNATFLQTNGFASGSLFLRLNSNAPAGTYSNQVVALTSGSASNSIAISNSTVNRYPITVGALATNKVYGTADPTLTYTSPALLFSDTFSGSITRAAGTNAGTYAITQGTLTNANYDITFLTNTFTITPKALSITANNVTKAFGVALTSPQAGSGAFTQSGLLTNETISSVTITYTSGADSSATAGLYTGVVVPSAPVGINTNNYAITFVAGNLTVDASPTLTLSTPSLSAFSTTYGTNSANQSFTVIGGNLSNNVTVAASSPFQVSTNASADFAASLVLTAVSNAVPSTTIFVRLPATASASTNHTGTITVSSSGASDGTIAIAASTVSPKGLTIGGLTSSNRVYDATTNGTVTGTPVYVGQVNGESNAVIPVVTWSFATKTVGTNKAQTASTNFAPPNSNYTITAQPAFSNNITQAALTLTNVVATNRAYVLGNTNVAVGGTLVGLFSNDVVTPVFTGTVASANAGTNLPVTVAVSLTGADAANYTVANPSGVRVDITQASNLITFTEPPAMLAGVTNVLSATASSGLTVVYASGNTNVARISNNTVISVAPGSATITASQAGDGNYLAADPVTRVLRVTGSLGSGTSTNIGWNFGSTSENASPTNSAENLAVGVLTNGNNNGTVALLSTTSPSDNTGASGSFNAGAAARIGAISTSTNGSAYFEFTLTPTNGYGFTVTAVSFGSRSTGTGPTAYSIRSSADSYGSDLATGTMNNNSGWALESNTGLNIQGVDATTFRIYGHSGSGGASANTANWRIDDLILTVSVAPVLPGITPSGTFGTLSTTYGTASGSSSAVLVSGGSLTSNITASAPANFEVSADGTSWAGTAIFTNDGGFASGSLFLRLASNAAAQTFSNQVVALTSGSASNSVAIANSTVSPKALTVTGIGPITKVYNGSNNATFTGTLDGVVGSDAVTLNGTGTYASVNAGTNIAVTSTATLGGAAAGNYSLTQPTGLSGSITAATLTVTAVAKSKVYGAGDPALTYTTSGLVGGDSLSGSLARTAGENVGTYAINQGTLTNSNYEISFNSANLTITAAALPAVSWGTATITNSNGVSGFSYLYTGRSSNGISTSYSNNVAPAAAGYYTAVATSTDGNYTGSSTNQFHVAGPVAVADTITKPAAFRDFTYKVSDLLLNDQRIHTNGAVLTTSLSITNVTSGTATAQLSDPDVLISRGTNATTAFTYLLLDSVTGLSTTGSVSVLTGGEVPAFDLQIVRLVSGPTGNTNTATTTMVLDFIGVPNNSYAMVWSPDLTNWVTIGNHSTGPSGSFTVTNTVNGIYTNRGFFRAIINP